MKTLLFLTVILLAMTGEVFSQARENHYHIEAPNLPDNVLGPTEVYFIQGRNRQKDPTWGLFETYGGDTTIYANDVLLEKWDDTLSWYSLKGRDTIFALPTKHYSMESKILRTRKEKKIEVATFSFDKPPCTKKTGIKFGDDSVTTNTGVPYKMFLEKKAEDAHWKSEGKYFLPRFLTTEVDTCDKTVDKEGYAYGIVMVRDDGVMCDIVWLNTIDRPVGPITTEYYMISCEDWGRFGKRDGKYTFDDITFDGFKILENAPEKPKGIEKRRHEKRDRAY